MRKIILKYRLKLTYQAILQNPLWQILNNEFQNQDWDFEMYDETNCPVAGYINTNLDSDNCYEGFAHITFYGNIKNKNLPYYLFNGNYSIDSFSNLDFIMQMGEYAIYKMSGTNDYYLLRTDLKPLLPVLNNDWPKLWAAMTCLYIDCYGAVAPDAAINDFLFSEDKKVAKLKIGGLYMAEEFQSIPEKRLNRVLPS